MRPLTPRVKAALKAYGVTELYLMDSPVIARRPGLIKRRLNTDVRHERYILSTTPVYSAPGLRCQFYPAALGLDPAGELPEIWYPPAETGKVPVYTGLRAVRRDADIYLIPGGRYWTNGHIAVLGPEPGGPYGPVDSAATGARVEELAARCNTHLDPDFTTVYEVEKMRLYRLGGVYFQAALVDFLIRNARKGVTLTYMMGSVALTVYGDLFLIGVVMAVNYKREGAALPHQPPKQGGILPWS